MSQVTWLVQGSGSNTPVETLTPDNGNPVTADAGGNIDVFGGAGANGAVNIQTDGNPIGAIPINELDIRLTDSILLPTTNASGSEGVIAMGSTSYVTDRIFFYYNDSLFIGYQAGNFTVGAGLGNVGVGKEVLQNVSTGRDNTAIGMQALKNLTTATDSTAVGIRALGSITTQSGSTAVGYEALFNSTGDANSVLGRAAMLSATTASFCVAMGRNALTSNVSGHNNVSIGYNSQQFHVGGSDNVTVGTQCLRNSVGSPLQNTAVGSRALESCTSDQNTSFGYGNLGALTSGENNHSGGAGSLGGLLTGSRNSACGSTSATNLVSGSNNIFAGYASGSAYTTSESSNIIIGNAGTIGESNTIRLGTHGGGVAQQNRCFVSGINGVTVANTRIVTINSVTHQLGTQVVPSGVTQWSTISIDQTAAVNNGYFMNKAGTLALALPATSAVGDVIRVANINTALGTQLTQAAGQQIFIGNTSTTLGAAGTLTSIAVGDTLELVCRTANLEWQVVSGWANWTPA